MGLHEGDGGDEPVGGDVGADAYGKRYHEAQSELQDEFALLAHAFLIVLEDLDVVVREAYAAAPQGGDEQQYGIDAVQTADQQGGAHYGHDDDEAAHGGCAFLLRLALQSEVADVFTYLVLFEPADDLPAGEEADEHTDHQRQHCPERQVMHQSHTGEVYSKAFQPVYKVVEHWLKISVTISFSSKWRFSFPIIW